MGSRFSFPRSFRGGARHLVNTALGAFGYRVVRTQRGGLPLDFRHEERIIVKAVQRYTMTSPERIKVLIDAVKHVCGFPVPGAIVECGVWRGGSMMAAALTLLHQGDIRDLYLYDAFDQPLPLPAPGDGLPATGSTGTRQSRPTTYWSRVSADIVSENLSSTNYPDSRVHFVRGPVELTIPKTLPERISVLRLDTDHYQSTLHELNHLYPRLASGGILIVDDFGSHIGARKAVDEYFSGSMPRPFLCRIDHGGVLGVKA